MWKIKWQISKSWFFLKLGSTAQNTGNCCKEAINLFHSELICSRKQAWDLAKFCEICHCVSKTSRNLRSFQFWAWDSGLRMFIDQRSQMMVDISFTSWWFEEIDTSMHTYTTCTDSYASNLILRIGSIWVRVIVHIEKRIVVTSEKNKKMANGVSLDHCAYISLAYISDLFYIRRSS